MKSLKYLTAVRNLTILKELINSERYADITERYADIFENPQYWNYSSKVKYNLKVLKSIFIEKDFGRCIKSIDAIIKALNNRAFDFKCEQDWDSLLVTSEEDVKFCSQCSKHVFKAFSEVDLLKRSSLGQCVFYSENISFNKYSSGCSLHIKHEFMGLPCGVEDFDKHESDDELPFKE